MRTRILNRSPLALNRDGYQVKAAEILLYDEIGIWGVTARQFAHDLRAIESDQVTIRINSPGGDVFDGLAIHNAIKNDPREISIVIDGLAASAASFIAMAGNKVTIAKNGFVMIHNAWGIVGGNANDLRETADFLDKIDVQISVMYADKGTETAEAFAGMMDAETWFNADEARALGIVDAIEGEAAVTALFDLSEFSNVPAAIKRQVENGLRDAGYPRDMAKTAVARGFSALEREAPTSDCREGDVGRLIETLAKYGY